MKQRIINIVLVAFFMMLAACSSEDPSVAAEKNGRSFFKSLKQGEISVCYELVDFNSYGKENENDKWRPIRLDGLYLNERIIFHNGDVYEPLMLTKGGGIHILEMPYQAYRMATGFGESIYIVAPLEYDEEDHSFTFHSKEYMIESATKSKLLLIQYYPSPYEEIWKTELEYESMSFPEEEIKNGLVFDSEGEACLYIVGLLREQFGENFDLNPYLEQLGIQNDSPTIVDIDELEVIIKHIYGFE